MHTLFSVFLKQGSQNLKSKAFSTCSLYNRGKDFQRTDAERLFRHLVLTRVLSEKLFIGNHENVISYVMLGPKAREVLMNKPKVIFFIWKIIGFISGREKDVLG